MSGSVDEVLANTANNLRNYGAAAVKLMGEQLADLARQHQLMISQLPLDSSRLRIVSDSFGYGCEPVSDCLNPFSPSTVGPGAQVFHPAALGGSTLPKHDYKVVRIITPNIRVSALTAVRLFPDGQSVAESLARIRRSFVDSVRDTLIGAKRACYGTEHVIPYDAIGSMTFVGSHELRLWKNPPGDLLYFRVSTCLGLTIIPGRAVVAEVETSTTNDKE